MKTYVVLFVVSALLTAFISCRTERSDHQLLSRALEMAGENRTELERVLQHYASPADSLKKEAAIFLIKYMPGKYAKVYHEYNQFKPLFDTLEMLNFAYEHGPNHANSKYYKFYKHTVFNDFLTTHGIKLDNSLSYSIKEDITTITAEYLIENIEYAFKAWDLPWNRTLSFSDFCEYILPYRYGNEELTHWRKAYFDENSHLLDSFQNEEDPLPVCMDFKALHKITQSEIGKLKPLENAIKAFDLIRINTATSCLDETGSVMLRLRALGIPITRIRFPNWGNWGSGHDINGVLTLEKEWFPLHGGARVGRYVPSGNYKIAKAFVETYSYDEESYAIGTSGNQFTKMQSYRDVTEYVTEVSDVKVSFSLHRPNSLGCLCVFNNSNWIPIACEQMAGRQVQFTDVGKGVVYLKGVITDGSLITEGQPFLLDDDGEMVSFDPLHSQITLTLDRKYPPNERLRGFAPTLAGSYFQGANKADFSDAISLWKIDSLPTLQKIRTSVPKVSYRYVRFVFANIDRLNEALGGIQMYGMNGELLKGTPISSIPGLPTFYRHVFDNSPFTFVRVLTKRYADFTQFYDGENLVVPDSSPFWVGLDLGTERVITDLEISPRTDGNDIYIGETYELFYWDDGHWISLGKKTAVATHITFAAPKGALYLLKNADKGREHRIFRYSANRQIWY